MKIVYDTCTENCIKEYYLSKFNSLNIDDARLIINEILTGHRNEYDKLKLKYDELIENALIESCDKKTECSLNCISNDLINRLSIIQSLKNALVEYLY